MNSTYQIDDKAEFIYFSAINASIGEITAVLLTLICLLYAQTSHAFSVTTNSTVFALAEQTDGKTLIGGAFTFVTFTDGSVRPYNRLVRLNKDGTEDTSFEIGEGINGTVFAVELQADGKILIAGEFSSVNGVMRNNIARLNTNGSLDTAFATGSGTNGAVLALAIQADQKVLLGGVFDTVRAINLNNLARLNTDSSVDGEFDPGDGPNGVVRDIALTPDGKIVIGGDFTLVKGSSRGMFARLDSTGSVESGFGSIRRANGVVREVEVQADGKTLIAGDFTTVGGSPRNRVARIESNGLLDTSFTAGSGADALIDAMALLSNGQILIGGAFTTLRAGARNRVARLNSDSSVDTDFDAGSGPDDIVSTILPLSTGKILIGGFFANVGNNNRPHLARLTNSGSLDQIEPDEICLPIRSSNQNTVVVCL